jgi:predicted permease
MAPNERSLVAKLDRLSVERLARAEGLPPELAARVAETVTGSGLPDDRRDEVFHELVGHFQDGLAAGQSPGGLLGAFGDPTAAARQIGRAKRVVTSESQGGAGSGDGPIRRLLRDLRYAGRRLKAKPLFTGIAIVSLGLAIGANTAMFTLVNDVIFRRPPIERPEELVDVYGSSVEFPFNALSEPDVEDLKREVDAFAVVASTKFSMVAYEIDGVITRLAVEMVRPEYFQLLGLRAQRGRLMEASDAAAPGQSAVVVLSDRFWRRAFGANPAVIGTTLRANGAGYTIIGVAPPEYQGRIRGMPTDLYVPITMINQLERSSVDQLHDRNTQGTFVKARLKPGMSLPQAQVEVDRLAAELRAQRVGQWEQGGSFRLIPSEDVIVFPPLDRILRPLAAMLIVVVALVLVVACANLAGFLLARAVDRRKEIAVRLALGATRPQLITQLLVETILLSILGGALGLALGRVALRAVLSAELPFPVPVALDLALDARVLGFSVLVSILAGVVFGLAPALQATRLDLASVIRDETTGGGRSRGAIRNLLLGGQVAVSMVLMVVGALFARSLDRARHVDAGFGAKPAALVWIGYPGDQGTAADQALLSRLSRELGAVPGIRRVGLASNIHLNTLSTQSMGILVDGVEPPVGKSYHDIDRAEVDTGFVAAMGLRFAGGRNFTARDADSVPRVAIVNEAFVAKFWPGRDGVGQRFRGRSGKEIEVVGVVNTAKIRSLGEEPRPFVYLPIWAGGGSLWIVAQTGGDPDRTAIAIQGALREMEPRTFTMASHSLRRHVEVMSLPLEMSATALMAFALLALLLACVGLYGAVNYAVARRSREVGIRLSLGADRGSVIGLLLWSGLRLVVVGAAVGLTVSIAVGRLLEGMLFGVRALDPVTLSLVPLLLLVVATVAAYLPARRAGRVSPIAALKAE